MAWPVPDPARPGEESVWDYPRPPRLEPVRERLRVVLGGTVIADTVAGFRVLETSHPPTYYVPPGDIRPDALEHPRRGGICEWKGQARLFDVRGGAPSVPGGPLTVPAGPLTVPAGAWTYPDPTPDFRRIAGYVAFYAGPMDGCFVGAMQVTPQPGTFYGGWITPGIVGPFKGGPGTMGW